MANIPQHSLPALGEKLTKEGPHKVEKTPRRIRGRYGGDWLFDTTKAIYVWEHPYYPYFYIPRSEFAKGVVIEKVDSSTTKSFWVGRLSVGGKVVTEDVLVFETLGALKDVVKIAVAALDWYAEDEKLLGTHPRDPYKRVEIFPASREVRIEVDGHVIAQSRQNMFLYETSLRTRYYVDPTFVNWEYLTESETISYCPYKGKANYYNIVVGGKEIKDAVWYYEYPRHESLFVAGKLCFYNEKVDVFIDGIKEPYNPNGTPLPGDA
ncbi:hypothetical protein F5884DRAFT_286752 [Xylogone sp. PMI_703]|nr:hypothetical protein F5884DRAFT_286752 [Xylogone sp. PMI_703]